MVTGAPASPPAILRAWAVLPRRGPSLEGFPSGADVALKEAFAFSQTTALE